MATEENDVKSVAFDVDSALAGVGDVAASIMDSAPEPQPHVIEQQAAREESGPALDAAGVPFDPNIHAKNVLGEGVKTATGLWRRRRGTGSVRGVSHVAVPQAPSAQDQAAMAAGVALSQMTFLIGQVIGGAEWAPRKIADDSGKVVLDEDSMLTDAYTKYCATKGILDVPPGVALTFALVCYAAPRLAMPETQQRVGTVKGWLSMRVAKWRVKRELRKRGIKNARVSIHRVGAPVRESAQFEILVNGEPYTGE